VTAVRATMVPLVKVRVPVPNEALLPTTTVWVAEFNVNSPELPLALGRKACPSLPRSRDWNR
jgi:hypothetical protein